MAKVEKNERWITRSGQIITGEIAEEIADEAERGYDLSKATRVLVGRPSLGENGTSPRLAFRAPPELYDAIRQRAEEEGRSISELAREAVERYIRS